jgi:putative inorganic carbon (hco3(-)) transporter
MNKTAHVWMAIAGVLAVRAFVRPAYAVALYMFTFLVAPTFWWWGNMLENYRWNFFAGVLLLAAVLLVKDDRPASAEPPLRTTAVPILVLMAANATLVHIMLAVNPDPSLGWLIARLKFILLFFMIQYAIRDEKDYRIITLAITLGMGYIAYEATINERGSFSGGRLEGIGAAGVNSSNQLASLLVTGLPLAVTVLFTTIPNWTKGVVLVAAGLTFNLILLCNSRGSLLGLVVGGLVFLYMASGPARKQSRRILALAAVATLLLLGDVRIIDRFMSTFQTGEQRDASAQSRLEFWSAAWNMVQDYPLGSGGNSFSEGRGWQYLARAPGPGDTRAVHNGFITEMTDWGIQGFLITLSFIGAVWFTLQRGRRLALAARAGA